MTPNERTPANKRYELFTENTHLLSLTAVYIILMYHLGIIETDMRAVDGPEPETAKTLLKVLPYIWIRPYMQGMIGMRPL